MIRSKSGRGDAPPGAFFASVSALSNSIGLFGLGAKRGSSSGDLEAGKRSVPAVDLERTDMDSLCISASNSVGGRLLLCVKPGEVMGGGLLLWTTLEKAPKKSSSSSATVVTTGAGTTASGTVVGAG